MIHHDPAYRETLRVVNLPVVTPPSEKVCESVSKELVLPHAYEDGFRLRPAQAFALLSYRKFGRLVAPLGVGDGKTLISLLIADLAIREKGHSRVIILVPPFVCTQLTKHDLPWARSRVALTSTFVNLYRKNPARRYHVTRSSGKSVFIFPYSLLSVKDTDRLLKNISPDLIIADEAHNLSNPRTARTRRLFKCIRENQVKFIPLSGTITSRSLTDFATIVNTALGTESFLPLSQDYLIRWANVLDSERSVYSAGEDLPETDDEELDKRAHGELYPLIQWAAAARPEKRSIFSRFTVTSVRQAFRIRMRTCPGVVCSDSEVPNSLVFHTINANKKSDYLQELQDRLRESWVSPGGDEIDFAFNLYNWETQLTAGFYQNLYWPDKDEIRRRFPEHDPSEVLRGALEKFHLKKEYNYLLRQFLSSPPVGLDTPLLVANGILHNNPLIPQELKEAYHNHREHPSTLERDSETVWVDYYKIQALGNFLEKRTDEGVLIWVHHKAVGRKLHELLSWFFGEDKVAYFPAGHKSNVRIINPENKNKFCIASLRGHGEGKNLQHLFDTCVYFEWPRPAKHAEQSIGRIHRQGQQSDEVHVHFLLDSKDTGRFDHMALCATLYDAIYLNGITNQKLIYGTYETMPQIFPTRLLVERGIEVNEDRERFHKALQDRFGIEP